jgi:AcrR family transcriptional regulator
VADAPTRGRTTRRAGSKSSKGVDKAGPRTRKGEQTRAQLVAAAKTVFERDGFLGARIVDIAETASLATGSFYHYFDSKEQIFREVAQLQEQRLTAPQGGAVSERGDARTAWDRIRLANRRYLERYENEAALMGVIEQVSRYDNEVNEARMATMKHCVARAWPIPGSTPPWPPMPWVPWSPGSPSNGSCRATAPTTSTTPSSS